MIKPVLKTSLRMLSLVIPLALSACAKQNTKTEKIAFPEVTLPGSEVRTLKSSATGRTYDIYIHTPGDYAQHPDKHYPVLYVLDGQWDFKLLDSVHGGLLFDQFVPEMFIIGITYAGESPDYEALRAMDYSPVPIAEIPGSGDAPKFLAFLKDELFPLIEAHYRVDAAQRVLMGSSFGGSFTLYALFAEPEIFFGYIAASPAVPYADNAAFQQEAEYASKHQELPVRLFISVGELERLANPVKAYIDILNQRAYSELEMETRIIEGERHAGNKPEAFNRGLRFIFQE